MITNALLRHPRALMAVLAVARLVVRSGPYLPAAGWALAGVYAYLAMVCVTYWPVGLLLIAVLAAVSWWLVRDLPERVRRLEASLDAFWQGLREDGAR